METFDDCWLVGVANAVNQAIGWVHETLRRSGAQLRISWRRGHQRVCNTWRRMWERRCSLWRRKYWMATVLLAKMDPWLWIRRLEPDRLVRPPIAVSSISTAGFDKRNNCCRKPGTLSRECPERKPRGDMWIYSQRCCPNGRLGAQSMPEMRSMRASPKNSLKPSKQGWDSATLLNTLGYSCTIMLRYVVLDMNNEDFARWDSANKSSLSCMEVNDLENRNAY